MPFGLKKTRHDVGREPRTARSVALLLVKREVYLFKQGVMASNSKSYR